MANSKIEVIDYYTNRLCEGDKMPTGCYSITIVDYLHDGRPVAKILDGPCEGKFIIGPYVYAHPDEIQTLH